jgi:superfamily II DNA or RNA helicase
VGAQESRKPVNGKIVESHLLSKILKNLPSKYRFGLTGTLPNNLLSSWNIIGKIGPILSVLSNSDVREKGTATDIHIKAIYFIHQEFPDAPMIEVDGEWVEDPFPTAKYEKEKQFLYKNQARNEVIYKICDDSSINTMILVDSLEQGQILFDNISAKKECYFVTGEMPTSERQAIIDAMEDRVGIVCVAMSKCFSTGINIKNLHRLVLPFVGKSVVKIMQSIGRTMRKHSSKKKSYIFDISDNTEYSKKHFLERLELYDKEKIKYTIKKIKL